MLSLQTRTALKNIEVLIHKDHKVVLVTGNFNIVHPGHLRLLRFAAECGDFLVVGVHNQGSRSTLMDENLRLEGVSAISWVDHAFILEETPEVLIEHLKPDVVVKGKEYEAKENSEKLALSAYGGKLIFSSGDVRFSSVDLLKNEFQLLNLSTIKKPEAFLGRHEFKLRDLYPIIEGMKSLRVAVLGDVIVDEYVNCDPLGMSREDPTIVVSPIFSDKFTGGAGIVAGHASSLGARVDFFSVIGEGDSGVLAEEHLQKFGVRHHLYQDTSRPTPLKQRFITEGKTLLRVNHLKQHAITEELQSRIFCDVEKIIGDIDLLIFSDFNYGCLPQPLVERVIELGLKHGVRMVADSQCSSQVGDVSRYHSMFLLTPTEHEARLAMQDFDSGLVVLAEKLRQKARAQNIFMTLGSEGVLIHAGGGEGADSWDTDRLPAFNTSPKDPAGAGDSMLVCSAMASTLGASVWASIYLGSLAAACQVGRTGNIPLTEEDLIAEIEAG